MGAPIPEHMQGESWFPLLQPDGEGREGFLYEYYKESDYRPRGGFPGTPTLHAYRTEDWKLVRYPDGDTRASSTTFRPIQRNSIITLRIQNMRQS